MHKLYELKEMLCEELKEYGDKKLDAGSLEVIDKLAHSIKNIDKIIEAYDEEEYSMAGGSYEGGGSYARGGRGNRGGGRSNAGGGGSYAYARGGGSYARRDSRGRYSRESGYSRAEDDFKMQLEELMQDAPNEQIRQKMQRIMGDM